MFSNGNIHIAETHVFTTPVQFSSYAASNALGASHWLTGWLAVAGWAAEAYRHAPRTANCKGHVKVVAQKPIPHSRFSSNIRLEIFPLCNNTSTCSRIGRQQTRVGLS